MQPTRSYLDGGTGGEITVAFFFDHPLSCANCGARRDIGFDAPHPGASCPHRLPCGLRYYAHMIGWVGNPEGCGVWGRDGRGEGRGGVGSSKVEVSYNNGLPGTGEERAGEERAGIERRTNVDTSLST